MTGSTRDLGGTPGGKNQTHRNQERKGERDREEVSPTQHRDRRKTERERPRNAAHLCSRLYRKATQLPSQHRCEEQKHRNEKSESDKEVPITPVKTL